MAKNIANSHNIIITFFLLFLCTFSLSARTPFDSSEVNNVNDNIDQTNHDDNAILLPSENLPEPDSEPAATLIQYEPEETTDISKTEEPTTSTKTKTKTKTETTEGSKPLPFTVFRFGPIDRSRNIPRRPLLPLSYRRPVHHCHHAHNHYKPWNNRHLPRRDSDVVMTKFNEDFDRVARGGARDIPVEWMKYSYNVDEPMMFSHERSNAMEKSELLRRIYNRYHQQRRQEQGAEAEIKDNGSTFVKRIRKFLNRF